MAPARSVRPNPSTSCAPMRCAAMIPVPLTKPKAAKVSASETVFAAVAPASATIPKLPIAIVSTTPSS